MKITVLQLNIQGGRYIDRVISYIKEHDVAIVQLQEVSGAQQSRTCYDTFAYLKEKLGYSGVLAVSSRYSKDPASYMGVATLCKPSLTYSCQQVIWLKPFRRIDESFHTDREKTKDLPRNALALLFHLNGQDVWFINAHLAWGPTPYDEPYKLKQAQYLHNFLAECRDPFVLTGDFNVTSQSAIIRKIEDYAVNHITQRGVTNTLNSSVHRATSLFPPGLAVDYIFTAPAITASNFSVVDTPDLSDHYGLQIEVDII